MSWGHSFTWTKKLHDFFLLFFHTMISSTWWKCLYQLTPSVLKIAGYQGGQVESYNAALPFFVRRKVRTFEVFHQISDVWARKEVFFSLFHYTFPPPFTHQFGPDTTLTFKCVEPRVYIWTGFSRDTKSSTSINPQRMLACRKKMYIFFLQSQNQTIKIKRNEPTNFNPRFLSDLCNDSLLLFFPEYPEDFLRSSPFTCTASCSPSPTKFCETKHGWRGFSLSNTGAWESSTVVEIHLPYFSCA